MKFNNGEIYSAVDALNKLTPEGTTFPVRVSSDIVHLRTKLRDPYQEIEEVRNGLIKTYGEADKDNPQQIKVNPEIEKRDDSGKTIMDEDGKSIMEPNPKFGKFAEEINELFAQEVEVVFDKVKLPEKVASTCGKCNHNMDKMLEIEPSVLMALEKFVEV